MTALDAYLSAVRARAAAATPGPWAWQKIGGHYHLVGQHGMRPIILSASSRNRTPYLTNRHTATDLLSELTPEHPDSQFTAAARTDVDRLVAMVEAARKALEAQCNGYVTAGKARAARAALDELDRLAGETT